MSKLLVVAHREDEAPIAINKSLELALSHNANIHVMAFCYEDFESITGFAAKQLEDVKQQIIDKKYAWLQEELAKIDGFQGKITCEVQWQKDIYKGIVREAETNEYQLIVTQRHRTESFFHIPTEWYLLRESSVPIVIAHEDKWKDSKTILVAVDLKNNSAEGKLMRRQVLSTASEFAALVDGNLQCCFSVELPEVLIDLDVIDSEKYQQDAKEKYLPTLEALAGEYGIAKDCVHIKFGPAEKCVASIATRTKAQAVVIGSLARKGIKGKLVGNTAEKLTEYLHTDLLIVPPQ